MPADIILGLIWITQLTRSYSPGAGSSNAVWKWGWEPHFPGCETQGTLFSQHSLGQMWLWKTDEFWWSSCTLTNIPLFQHAVISEKCEVAHVAEIERPPLLSCLLTEVLSSWGVAITGPRSMLGAHFTPPSLFPLLCSSGTPVLGRLFGQLEVFYYPLLWGQLLSLSFVGG